MQWVDFGRGLGTWIVRRYQARTVRRCLRFLCRTCLNYPDSQNAIDTNVPLEGKACVFR